MIPAKKMQTLPSSAAAPAGGRRHMSPALILSLICVSDVTLVSVAGLVNVTVVVMEDNTNPNLRFGWNRTMPAVNMAEEEVKRLYRDQINFTFIYHETSCRSVGASASFADLQCRYDGISVLIGPGCSVPMYSIAPLAMAWNIPVVNPIASGLSDREEYPLVTALSPFSPASFVGSIRAFLVKFSYTNVIIIEDVYPGYATPSILRKGMVDALRDMPGYKWRLYQVNSLNVVESDITKMLDQAKANGRVFIMFTRIEATRAVMLESLRLGMATSGEYVYIINYKLSWGPGDKITWQDKDATDEENRSFLKSLGQAYFPYMEAWPEIHVGNAFTDELIHRSLRDYGFEYDGVLPTQWIPGYYDAVMLYAQVLNETLAAGGSPADGTAITHSFVNRTFPGILREVKVNGEGIRLNDVTFGYYDLNTTGWKRAAIWYYQADQFELVTPPGFVWRYNQGVPPPNEPECGYLMETCTPGSEQETVIALAVGLVVGLLFAGLLIGALLYRLWRKNMGMDLWWWKIEPSDLAFLNAELNSVFGSSVLKALPEKHHLQSISISVGTMRSRRALGEMDAVSISPSELIIDGSCAIWKGQKVKVSKLELKQTSPSQAILQEFLIIRELNHTNIGRVLGAVLDPTLTALITERCSKGSLQDLLENMNVTLDDQFKFSLCTDIVNGLCYLHESAVRYHGRLTSQSCVIDNRFTVKLADYGLPSLHAAVIVDKTSQEFTNECLWKAPEVLRSDTRLEGGREADVYSLGIVMQEVFTREPPYYAERDLMTVNEILDKVQSGLCPPFRPSSKLSAKSDDMRSVIEMCWTEDPKQRPTSQAVRTSLKKVASSLGTSTNILDNLMRRMEMYANNLEKMCEEKTIELREEKKKSENLLYQILPRSVANKLRLGQRVEPQTYNSVTIFFSDIVGFTSLSAESSPMEIVALLNDLYTCFDAILEEYDVYKVETIGDAYMVVSGLPQENGNLHAVHIANMSLKLLEAITVFKVRHRPGMSIMLRIGCHSGSVVAGVVGLKMPRYCLFGDTVNTASRMESNGEALKIHLSESVKEILDTFGTFVIESRGTIPIKGKGYMETFWLQGRAETVKPFDQTVANLMDNTKTAAEA